MSAETKVLNAKKVTYVKPPSINIPVKGSDWFEEPYSNIFILAKKKSGKTNLIENILKHTTGKNTKFIFVVSTLNKDATWRRIINKFKDHDIAEFTDLISNDNGDKVNVIDEFLNDQNNPEPDSDSETAETQSKIVATKKMSGGSRRIITKTEIGTELKPLPELKPKIKQLYPEYIIVFDDLGAAMRDPAVTQLLKTNRHYKAKVILSAQNLTDLAPGAIRQLDYTLAFGRIPDDRLEKLREELDLDISKEKFHEIYKDATAKPYHFLYISRTDEDKFRKDFNEEYNI